MEFQELDFHKLLYQAYLEPPGARNQFLDRIRKKESYKRVEFLTKLEEALDHFKQALEIESKNVRFTNVEDFGFPISALNRYEPLRPFSSNFSDHISKAVLNELGKILALYKFEQTAKRVNKILDQKLNESQIKTQSPLQSIWMDRPKNQIEYILEKGYALGVWDEEYKLQTKRNGLYGHGKRFLSNLYHSLIGNSIKEEIHYENVGKILCDFFGVEIGRAKEPFKTFQNGNPKQKELLKKDFRFF